MIGGVKGRNEKPELFSRVREEPVVVAHLGGRGRRISEFEASLVYKVSSRTAQGYTEKHCLEKPRKKKKKELEKAGLHLSSVPVTSLPCH